MRLCLEPAVAAAVPHPAGPRRRRHGAGRAVDPGRLPSRRQKRGQAFALFGVAVVVAPVVGPTLGGWLSDNFSWHWCFLINGPVGVLAIALIALILREPEAARGAQAAAAARRRIRSSSASCWSRPSSARSRSCSTAASRTTGSARPSSSTFAAICALAFVLMIPWELSRRNPMIDLRMVATRQFGACFLVMLATGAILLATTQFLPQLVQQNFGYTATWAGLVLSPGGLVTMVMMFVVGRLAAKVQPKYLIVAGAVIIALSDVRPDQRLRRSRLLVLRAHRACCSASDCR